jgi:hypothetical protein
MAAWRSDAASFVEGAARLVSPLRMTGAGADGGRGSSGVANGVPVSQSHSERLSGRRASPSHAGGAFDQIAQPPSCHAITQMMNSRRHIVLMPLFVIVVCCRRLLPTRLWFPPIACAAYCRLAGLLLPRRDRGWPTNGRRHKRRWLRPWRSQSLGS